MYNPEAGSLRCTFDLENKTSITVIDSVMGSGKSTYAIELVTRNPGQLYFIVVPTRSEVERYFSRIKDGLKGSVRELYAPHLDEDTDIKLLQDRLKAAVSEGKSIVTTHAMFQLLDETALELINSQHYSLILDEVTEIIYELSGSDKPVPKDYELLLNAGLIREEEYVNGVKRVVVTEKDDYFDPVNKKRLAHYKFMSSVRHGNMFKIHDEFLVWSSEPTKFFKFEQVFILTYLWSGSIMQAWFSYYDINPAMETINDYGVPVPFKHQGGKRFTNLITVEDSPKLNAIGSQRKSNRGRIGSPLSSSWFKKRATSEDIKTLKDGLRQFFRTTGLPASDCLWTTYMDQAERIAPQGYTFTGKASKAFDRRLWQSMDAQQKADSIAFLSHTTRATNLYKHKKAVAYVLDKNSYPGLLAYFRNVDCEFDADRFALSEMLQFIWRSAIRENQPIQLYIPSERMRNLFMAWLKED